MHICFVSITMMHRCCHILAVFVIIPSKENNLYFRSSSIYGFLTFRIGSERAERATLMRKYVTATVAALPDATKSWRGKMYIRVNPKAERQRHELTKIWSATLVVGRIHVESNGQSTSQERQCQI